MFSRLPRIARLASALTLLACAGPAFAAACSGISVGTASTDDVTFAGASSDQCVISGVNPQSGPNGDTSGFSTEFGGGWSLLAKLTSSDGAASLAGVNFAWTFAQTTTKLGTWTLTADQSVDLDLVFAMHASNRSGAFLFDDESLIASQVNNGTWKIEWLNNGGNVPDFSNVTLFARDITTAVPEPETYALFLAGLGMMGFMARRRKVA
jgi:hypothetical protein